MTDKYTSARIRLTRRRLMIATVGGAALIAPHRSDAAPPKLGLKANEDFKTLSNRCDRSLAMIGASTTVDELLGKSGKPFVEILDAGLKENGEYLDQAAKDAVKDLIAKLNNAQKGLGKKILYRDLLLKSPPEWGGKFQQQIVAAMTAGDSLFMQPHLKHLNLSAGSRIQTKYILDGWKTHSNKQAAGFIQLCGSESVIRAFTQRHSGIARHWIDEHLFSWLVRRNVAWSNSFAFLRGEKEVPAFLADCPTKVDNACTAFNGTKYYCEPGHPGKTCKLDSNNEPCTGADFCDPPRT